MAPSNDSADDPPVAPRPVRAWQLGAVLLATFALVALLGRVDPFLHLTDLWTGGGETTRMQQVEERPEHIDVHHGEHLLAALRAVPPPEQGSARVVVFGNSQQYTASLPRGATPSAEEAQMASVLLEQRLRDRGARVSVYNAAAPNQTLPEAMWQALYWFAVSADRPGDVLIQASFDTFRKTGIRPGYQTLLDEPRFVAALEARLAAAGRAYDAEWREARSDHAARAAQMGRSAEQSWSAERMLRDAMEGVDLFAARQKLKASFLGLLYVARVNLLRIRPTSRRHITGKPIEQSFGALEDLVVLAKSGGASVQLYNAPVNPAVDMFYPEEYQGYLTRLRALCEKHGVPFADLPDAVPAERWGYWIDGPDPIHFDAQAHHIVAGLLDGAFGADILSRTSR